MRRRFLLTLIILTLGSFAVYRVEAARRGPISPSLATADAAAETESLVTPQASPAAEGSGPNVAESNATAAPEVLDLQNDLEHLITNTGWRNDEWSVMVVSLDHGDTLFAHDPGTLLAPASNMKLFTSSAGLYYLGPDFRYNTFLLATGPIENGTLKGDLVVYGTGDPTFSNRFGRANAVWDAFADTLAALGVTRIEGAVVGDGSYFAGPGTGEGWKTDYMNAFYAATAGALQYDEGIGMVEVRPGAAGAPPLVKMVPGADGVAIQNEATTVAKGRTSIQVTRTSYDSPIVVRGRISRSTKVLQRSIPVPDPTLYAAAVFKEVLARHGIEATSVKAAHTPAESPVTGRSVFAPALSGSDPVRVLAIHNSEPLEDILSVMNHVSHNLLAEHTVRTVGRVTSGEGSAEAGTRAVLHLLDEAGVAQSTANEVAIVDGSGLSPLNRVNARTIVHLLSFMARSPLWNDFWETLPEAGASDGLHRMYRTGAEGNLRAKTGTIDNVSALSGYVHAADGEQLIFSIMSNNVPSTYRAKRIEDAIGARLAAFTRPLGEATTADAADTATHAATDTAAATVTSPPAAAPPAKTPTPKASSANTSSANTSGAKTSGAKTSGAKTARTYTVKKGDTLSEIAEANGVSLAALRKANPGLNARRLQPGKTIRLP